MCKMFRTIFLKMYLNASQSAKKSQISSFKHFRFGTKISAMKGPINRKSKRYTEKNNLFEGVLYQYFEGTYYERDYKRKITISITILFVHGEREKKK
jgi:hypothetical protein